MLTKILAFLPTNTHALFLVSDPDGLFDREVRVSLEQQGFRIVAETDPIALRHNVEQARPWLANQPLLVVTARPLHALPYDLWQQGQHVELTLQSLFPTLAYAALRELSPGQWRIFALTPTDQLPATPLGYEASLLALLPVLYDADPVRLRVPARLIVWLDQYHNQSDSMPAAMAQQLAKALQTASAITHWPLDQLITDAAFYRRWIQESFSASLESGISEQTVSYGQALSLFAEDSALQALIPQLVHSGTLLPIKRASTDAPLWAGMAIETPDAQTERTNLSDQLTALEQMLQAAEPGWENWQQVAHQWAHVNNRRYDLEQHHDNSQIEYFNQIRSTLDQQFAVWIQANYSRLAGQSLPKPTHLYHIPGWLAHQRLLQPEIKPALLVMDGLALADWLQIQNVWATRHPDWQWGETLVVAQVPSITAVSRQALISGKRPAQFAASFQSNRQEPKQWATFWESAEPSAIGGYTVLEDAVDAPLPELIGSRRVGALCIICRDIDEMVHGETQGTTGFQASLNVWLHDEDSRQQRSNRVERLIQRLFEFGYTVYITSDHGHTEAVGMGQPNEGVLVETRSKRARTYRNKETAQKAVDRFSDTLLWRDDGLLPEDVHVVVATGRRAFAQKDTLVVSHGGITIDELVVPLVTVRRHSDE